MNNKIVYFAGGVFVGLVLGNLYLEEKYKRISDDAIADVKKRYSVNKQGDRQKDACMDMDEYEELTKQYSTESKDIIDEKEENEMENLEYISPDELGDTDYEVRSLDYYQGDDVLAEGGEVVNSTKYVGNDFTKHFGVYETDTAYVRNHSLRSDFEICRDFGTFH